MAPHHLYLSAELNNVTNLKPQDSATAPFEYTFKIQCTKCHEIHDKPITVNLYEKHDLDGSRGQASFVGACSFCKYKSNIDIQLPKNYQGYTVENSGEKVRMLEISLRGFQIVEYIADGPFICKGAETISEFKEVDLLDEEWYDYDDIAGEETSITDIKWEIGI